MNVQLKGIWADKTPYNKFVILTGIVLMSLAIFLMIAVALVGPIFGVNIADPDLMNQVDNPNVINALKFIQTVQVLAFVVPAFFMALLIDGRPVEYLRINKKTTAGTILMAGAVMLLALPLINWLGEMNSRLILPEALSGIEKWMKNAEDQAAALSAAFLKMNSFGSYIFMTIMIALLPAIGEEFLFRGLIQRMFGEWIHNKHTAIILTAIIFSAVHMQFYGFVPRMVMGIILGYLFMWSGSIWVSVFAHFVNNATVVLFSYIGFNDIESIGISGTAGMVLVITSMVAVGGLMYTIRKREEKQTSIQ